jgi:hypothetical protein
METGIVNKSRFAPTGGGRRKAGTYLGDVDVVVERPVGGAVVILAAVIVQARHPPLLSSPPECSNRVPIRFALLPLSFCSLESSAFTVLFKPAGFPDRENRYNGQVCRLKFKFQCLITGLNSRGPIQISYLTCVLYLWLIFF